MRHEHEHEPNEEWAGRRGRGPRRGPGPEGFGPNAGWGPGPGGPRGRRMGPPGPGGMGAGPWMGGPFAGGPFGGGPFRRGARVGRGDVRAAIIALLGEQPMHGYQIIGELHDRSGGMWKPSPGSVYPTLQQLEDEGLVSAGQDDGKRVFSLTEAGRTVAGQAGDGPAPWEIANRGDAHLGELRDLAMTVGAAVMQVAHVGDRTHVEQAKKILEDTRRQLYRLLAGDTPNPADAPSTGDPTPGAGTAG